MARLCLSFSYLLQCGFFNPSFIQCIRFSQLVFVCLFHFILFYFQKKIKGQRQQIEIVLYIAIDSLCPSEFRILYVTILEWNSNVIIHRVGIISAMLAFIFYMSQTFIFLRFFFYCFILNCADIFSITFYFLQCFFNFIF